MKKRGYNKHNINHFKVMVLPLMITAIAIFVGNILTYVYNNIMIAFFISILAIVTFLIAGKIQKHIYYSGKCLKFNGNPCPLFK